MNKIIALAIKFSGGGFVWEKLNGYKVKLGGVGMMLGGAAMMLAGAASIVNALVACQAMDCCIAIFRGLTESKDAMSIGEGYLLFSGGLGILGIGHKLEKAQVPAIAQESASAPK